MRQMVIFFLFSLSCLQARTLSESRLRSAHSETDNWLMYGRSYAGWRYSELAEIHAGNVKQLVPAWIYQTGISGKMETTPLVYDGLMYLTGASNHAWAIDLKTGRPIWHHTSPVPPGVGLCCGEVNRGFAALDGRLFKVNIEGTLVALEAKSGKVLWETKIADYKDGFSATGAPLVVKNLVLTGVAGAEFGTRGFIDAYEASTGRRVWRFYTIPAPGEPGSDTWGGDSWARGGGSTWITGTYDPELNLIYWGTGNPGPDMNGDARPGDNLYTCSVVALDADTGQLKWHFQFTPHDVHDWDAISDPVLVDLTLKGRKVKALMQANRNGFFYLLDRTTGQFLLAKPYTKVTWAKGIDGKGRPILVPGQDPTEQGTKSCPGLGGGHNWQATTWSPQTGLYYFTSTDGCHIYHKLEQPFVQGQWYQGSVAVGIPREPTVGSVLALDPTTGDTQWRFEMVSNPSSGLLTTAGGLLFSGDREGYLVALNARTGRPLWKFQTGGTIIAPPITYRYGGRQYVAVASAGTVMAFAIPESQ